MLDLISLAPFGTWSSSFDSTKWFRVFLVSFRCSSKSNWLMVWLTRGLDPVISRGPSMPQSFFEAERNLMKELHLGSGMADKGLGKGRTREGLSAAANSVSWNGTSYKCVSLHLLVIPLPLPCLCNCQLRLEALHSTYLVIQSVCKLPTMMLGIQYYLWTAIIYLSHSHTLY